jgi:glycosyltransferase involved in cell wall biosynthesis
LLQNGKNNNFYARAKFDNYVRELGKYSVYLNPTLRSPMPRTRGEAMMCGLVTVSAKNHDVELFIKNGVNGFYSDNPRELREYLLYLCENPEAARKIGEASRQTAMDIFNHDRYLAEWEKTIKEVLK